MAHWIASAPYFSLSGHAETALRVLYGLLLTIQLCYTVPSARRFLVSSAHGGYLDSSTWADRLHTPLTARIILALWIASACAIWTGWFALAGAALNFAFARYFYLHMRWKTIGRGMGAPGHMNHWLGALVLLLIFSEQMDVAGGLLHSVTVATFRVDFAAIMVAAGIYKVAAGYGRGEGFEIGLVNPWWGHFPKTALRLRSDSWLFQLLNHLGYGVEILSGIAFLVPAVAPFAGLVLGLSFIGVGRIIRLTALAEMVAVTCLLYIYPGDVFDRALWFIPSAPVATTAPVLLQPLIVALVIVLAVYVVVLPFAYAGMAINLYAKRRLPDALQNLLDHWTKIFGLILWRVFTTDVINFHVEITVERNGLVESIPIPGPLAGKYAARFRHVGEFITLACVFNTAKYYPADVELFHRRLLTYARSVSPHAIVRFRYITITKSGGEFLFRPVAEFVADTSAFVVHERSLDSSFDVRRPADRSPVIAGSKPGSYAPG